MAVDVERGAAAEGGRHALVRGEKLSTIDRIGAVRREGPRRDVDDPAFVAYRTHRNGVGDVCHGAKADRDGIRGVGLRALAKRRGVCGVGERAVAHRGCVVFPSRRGACARALSDGRRVSVRVRAVGSLAIDAAARSGAATEGIATRKSVIADGNAAGSVRKGVGAVGGRLHSRLGRIRAKLCVVNVGQVFPRGTFVGAGDEEIGGTKSVTDPYKSHRLRKTHPGVDTHRDHDGRKQNEPLHEPAVFCDLDAVARSNAYDVCIKVWHLCPRFTD